MNHPAADLAHAPEQPLDAEEIVLGMLHRHCLEKAALAAADVHLQRGVALEDVAHVCPREIIRRDKLDLLGGIGFTGFFFAKGWSHGAQPIRARALPGKRVSIAGYPTARAVTNFPGFNIPCGSSADLSAAWTARLTGVVACGHQRCFGDADAVLAGDDAAPREHLREQFVERRRRLFSSPRIVV